MIQYCDITDWCNDSISDSQQSISEGTLECYTDINTNILCREFFFLDCIPLKFYTFVKQSLQECTQLCGNDSIYYLPVETDRILALQFHFKNTFDTGGVVTYGWNLNGESNILINAEIVNCCDAGDTIALSTVLYDNQYYVIKHANIDISGNTYYTDHEGIKIDVSKITFDCFYLKITVYNADLTTSTYYTLPFKKLNTCFVYVTLESDFDTTDNLLNLYTVDTDYDSGNPDITNFFAPDSKMIVRGEFIKVNSLIEQDFVNDNTKQVNSRIVDRYRLRLFPISADAMTILTNIISGKNLQINGEYFVIDGNIEKESDNRLDWTPEIFFKKYNDTKDFGCK